MSVSLSMMKLPRMDDLGAGPLQQATKDTDGGIVAVKKGGGGDKANLGLDFFFGVILGASRNSR
jgi:hypothetical protein